MRRPETARTRTDLTSGRLRHPSLASPLSRSIPTRIPTSSLRSNSFLPKRADLGAQSKGLGDGVPGFRTSFNVSGKGGGAFRPISENFSVNPANGTFSLAIPLQTSPARGGFGPDLKLSYDSGAGNGPFGFGWSVSLPSFSRKTSNGFPRYVDSVDELVYSGADIVPKCDEDGTIDTRLEALPHGDFEVTRYRPRVDAGLVCIERWNSIANCTDVHWRTISSENVTSIYGDTDSCRILDDSSDRKRVFSWLLSRSYDASGNAIEYSYKQEDGSGLTDERGQFPIWENNRSSDSRNRQKYIKSIKYSNRVSNRNLKTWEASSWPTDWLFEVIFDYGEHDFDSPGISEAQDWAVRKDAFSQNNAGFEIRTYRLCRRVLMFHHFPEHTRMRENLVASTLFLYEESRQKTVLATLTMSGHVVIGGGEQNDTVQYQNQALPSWDFRYTTIPELGQIEALSVNTTNLFDLPGVGSVFSEWVDLDREGVPGLLTRYQDGALTYQRNTGPDFSDDDAPFRRPKTLSQQPNLGSMKAALLQDLDRNGQLDLICHDAQGRPQGYYEREDSDSWSNYSDFPETPSGDHQSHVMTTIDITGQGLSDILCTLDDSQDLYWQQSLGKGGLSGYHRISSPTSNRPPRLTRNLDTHTFVADMTGDGLMDLVEISANAVTYWPNYGHGTFGSSVEMGDPPMLGQWSEFDLSRVRLIDVDGTGLTDLLYILPTGGAMLYYNLAGNSWTDGICIPTIPKTTTPASIFMLDILGSGTACLCWVDTFNTTSKTEIKYLDLMGGAKPHLLQGYSNGLGARTTVTYTPSTKFYFDDLVKGQPWSTKLPFPVQCISQLEIKDEITGNSSTTEYTYHNGCYDTIEKQFSGFEMVEELQRESLVLGADETFKTPVVLSKSWFSVGHSLRVDESRFFSASAVSSNLQGADDDTAMDCLRALKGAKIRYEVYGQDDSNRADVPFYVEEFSYDVKQIQAQFSNKHSVVQMNPRASVTFQYERDINDPRITHDIVLKTNLFGDIEQCLSVVYPRSAQATTPKQLEEVHKNQIAGNVSFAQSQFTNAVEERCNFRRPVLWKQKDYEILNLSLRKILDVDDIRNYDFEQLPESKIQTTWKALRSEQRTFYRNSALKGQLDGSEWKLQAFSVPHKSFSLVYTPEILEEIQSGQEKCGIAKSLDAIMIEGGYVNLDNNGHWWAPSSCAYFCDPEGSENELEKARSSFYTPTVFVDVFGHQSRLEMDTNFLLAQRVQDAMGNITLFENNYEHLQPVKITDKNLNVQQCVLNPLGQAIAMAVMGKSGEEIGDSLEGFQPSVYADDIDSILADPTGETSQRLLGKCSNRLIYCLDGYTRRELLKDSRTAGEMDLAAASCSATSPALIIEISRDLSFRESSNGTIHVGLTYLNGLGGALQQVQFSESNGLEKTWCFGGLSIDQSGGGTVRTYEPFFASSPRFVPAELMTTNATTNFHDALGRCICSLRSDHNWSKTIFTSWTTVKYSDEDMILCPNPQNDPNVGTYFTRLKPSRQYPTWYETCQAGSVQQRKAAIKSTVYSNSPVATHIGSCGLPVKQIQEAGGKTHTRAFVYDFSGNKVRDFDALDRLVEKKLYDKLNRCMFTAGIDSGVTWALENVQGRTLITWNSRGICFQYRYDKLGREIEKCMNKLTEPGKLVVKTIYGESFPEAASSNMRGEIWQVKDQSGIHVNVRFDIRNRCVEQTFQPAKEYKQVLDWRSQNRLEGLEFSLSSSFNNFGQLIENEDVLGNRTRRKFSRLGEVQSVEFYDDESENWVPYLVKATFTADGLATKMAYGNGVSTNFSYDEKSRNLISQRTVQTTKGKTALLEDFSHTYDCVGRRVYTFDASEQSKYFRNCRIKPEWEYTYDAIGQLVSSRGRGQLPLSTGKGTHLEPHTAVTGGTPARGSTDGNQLYEYRETYEYDLAGNIKSMKHAAPHESSVFGWTRNYFYDESSPLSEDPEIKSNRLSRTTIGSKEEKINSEDEKYGYDGDAGRVGCMTKLPKYSRLEWNMENMMSCSSTENFHNGTPQTTYYVYDNSGNRVRKVTESSAASGSAPRKQKDTLYFNGVEIQSRLRGDGTTNRSIRWIAQVIGTGLLALVESTDDGDDEILVRYQIGSSMELDESGQLISYEEYSPFGAVMYTALRGDIKAPRTYRFARYEHDRETGLYHCGARYYCPWLGRWTSPDPLGDVDGPNLYQYVLNDPINLDDPHGTSRERKYNPGQKKDEDLRDRDRNDSSDQRRGRDRRDRNYSSDQRRGKSRDEHSNDKNSNSDKDLGEKKTGTDPQIPTEEKTAAAIRLAFRQHFNESHFIPGSYRDELRGIINVDKWTVVLPGFVNLYVMKGEAVDKNPGEEQETFKMLAFDKQWDNFFNEKIPGGKRIEVYEKIQAYDTVKLAAARSAILQKLKSLLDDSKLMPWNALLDIRGTKDPYVPTSWTAVVPVTPYGKQKTDKTIDDVGLVAGGGNYSDLSYKNYPNLFQWYTPPKK